MIGYVTIGTNHFDKAVNFYDRHYEIIENWQLKPNDKVVLGNKQDRTCRFCGKNHQK